jgi:hypothetical protein
LLDGQQAGTFGLVSYRFVRYAFPMSRIFGYFALLGLSLLAQNVNGVDQDKQAAELKVLVEKAARSRLERKQISIPAREPGWDIGYPSAVTMDDAGMIYVLQRGEKADPVLVIDREGKIVRSWGKGLYQIPHSIRIDPQGNVWTVDSGSSMVLKFSPRGEKLMEISVGEQPAGRGRTNGTSDIAFGPNGPHLYLGRLW